MYGRQKRQQILPTDISTPLIPAAQEPNAATPANKYSDQTASGCKGAKMKMRELVSQMKFKMGQRLRCVKANTHQQRQQNNTTTPIPIEVARK